jgi:hypothetical protein
MIKYKSNNEYPTQTMSEKKKSVFEKYPSPQPTSRTLSKFSVDGMSKKILASQLARSSFISV